MSLGKKIKFARMENHMKQIELAEHLGIGSGTVSDYEHDKALPSLPMFKKICELLNLSADELLDLK